MWPEQLLTGAGLIFSVSLLPALFNAKTHVPVQASLPTLVGLVACTVADAGLGLWFAAITSAMDTAAWAFLVAFRRVKHPVLRDYPADLDAEEAELDSSAAAFRRVYERRG